MTDIKRHRQSILAVLAAGTAICAAYLVLRDSNVVQRTEVNNATPVSLAASSEQTDRVQRLSKVSVNPAATVTYKKPALIELANQLSAAKDLRKFSVEVQAHVAAGGVSYAMHATDLCRNLRMALENASIPWELADLPYAAPEDPRVHAVKNAALHRTKAACQDFTNGDFENSDLPAKAFAQGDPLFELKVQAHEINSASSLEDRRTILSAVLDNGDPLLISQTLQRLLLSDRAEGGVNIWIDGEQRPVMQSEMHFNALQVVHCRLGLPCGELSHDVLDTCIATGECFSNQVELFRSRMPQKEREEFDQTLAQLESTIRERRVDRFLPR